MRERGRERGREGEGKDVNDYSRISQLNDLHHRCPPLGVVYVHRGSIAGVCVCRGGMEIGVE